MLPAMDSRIFKIRGGNQQLPDRLLQVLPCAAMH